MVYLALHFDDDTDAGIRSVASSIAAGSAFEPQPSRFHVPLLGSLHNYTEDEVRMQGELGAPIRGRFIRWELQSDQVRVAVELEPAAGQALCQSLTAALPLGRPWQRLYTVIGSVAAIEVAQRGEFLKALEATFPLGESQTFVSRGALHLYESKPKPSRPPASSMDEIIKQTCKQRSSLSKATAKRPAAPKARSPHRTWVKGQRPADDDVTMRPAAPAASRSAIRKQKKAATAMMTGNSKTAFPMPRRVVVVSAGQRR